MGDLTDDQLMQNFDLVIERLRELDIQVLAFAKQSDQPIILIDVLMPPQLNAGAEHLKIKVIRPKRQTFNQTLYYGQFLDYPNIVLHWQRKDTVTKS